LQTDYKELKILSDRSKPETLMVITFVGIFGNYYFGIAVIIRVPIELKKIRYAFLKSLY